MGRQHVFFIPNNNATLSSVFLSPSVSFNFLSWVDAQPDDVLVASLQSQTLPSTRRNFLKIPQRQQPWRTSETGKAFVKLNRNLCVFTVYDVQ